jgi:hypothetical protein
MAERCKPENQAMETVVHKMVNRVASVQPAAGPRFVRRKAVEARAPIQIQTSLKVSSPADSAEKEADATARRIMRMSIPEGSIAYVRANGSGHGVFRQVKLEEKDKKLQRSFESPYITRFATSGIFTQKAEGQPDVSANVAADIQNSTATGSPLPLSVRRFMEPRFRADFSNVKIHTGDKSAKLNRQVNAHAFALGNNIFFGKDKFQPERDEGKELIAHELTHTIQQGGAVQRREDVTVTQQTQPMVQRGIVSEVLDYFADKAYNIPGFRMFTIIIGFNPINMSRADRSAANILRAIIEFLPGGHLITQALDNHGVFDKVGAWVEQQFATLASIGTSFKQALDAFIDSLGWRDVFRLGSVWDRAKALFTNPIDRLISFAKGLFNGIIKFIKDAILRPLAKLAESTRAYDLLKAVLGEDPITGDKVPQTADTIIGGFMKLIGQEEIWENIKKANAIPRAWAWFKVALSGLLGLVRSIPGRFISAFTSLTIMDIVLLPKAFAKIVAVFVGFVVDFVNWAGGTIWSLLEIIFAVVAPSAVPYLKKAAGAFRTILKNPVGFIGNLVRAGKLGFQMFASNIGEHLKAALIKWIVGPLGDAGVYIPKAFSLTEIVKLVLSVLGLTWQNIRAKLVKIIPEPVLVGLEKTAGILVTLVKDGPAAAWEQIKAELTELKDSLIVKMTEMITTEVVKAAVVKLVSMLNPVGAFVQAIIAIYNTITFFIQKINQIAAVVASFIDSIAAIAAGQVANAAKKVEQTMANTLTVIIAFLAKFAGLGNIPEKVVGIIKKIRQPIDKGLDKIVAWLGNMLKRLAGAVKTTVQSVFSWAFAKTTFTEAGGKGHSLYVQGDDDPKLIVASDPKDANAFLNWYLGTKSEAFVTKKAELVGQIRKHITAAKAIAKDIAALKKNGDAWKTRQQDMLQKNVELSAALSKLVGDDRSIADAIEKYKLEGITGTYGSIPKPPGDDFTADHQPQAAVLIAASKFKFFGKDGELNERAEGRAHAGYAINLYKARHVAGATFGSKGKETKESFLARVKPAVKDKPAAEQRRAVIMLLKSELRRDVAAIKSVVKAGHDAPIWKDVRDKADDNQAGQKLVGEIRGRILAGEDQIANQDLDSLAN